MFISFDVLYSTLYLFSFSEDELNIDDKKKELKKENNNIGVKNEERERREPV